MGSCHQTNIELADILTSTTDDIYALNPGFIGKLGTGRLNALAALEEALAYVDGVRNPISLSAESFDPASININWSHNADGNAVLLAFSETNEFGSPAEGEIYDGGEEIPGGGLVLYAGTDTSFLHEGLEAATVYYYRAWSFNELNAYSTGRSASAITACESAEIPFNEGFEENLSIPFCWVEEAVTGGINWAVGAGNGENNPASAFAGNSNMYHRSYGLFDNGLTTRLVTPQLNLGQVESAELNFHYTNALRSFLIFNYQDILHIRYKNAADGEWVLLQTFNTNVPNWTEVNIDLPELTDDYYIAFEAVANSGFGVCLDEININGEMMAGFYIAATAGENGSMEPEGNVFVQLGEDQEFEITADWGYHIGNLLVDDEAVSAAEGLENFSYNFENVQQAHSIAATFNPNMYDLQIEVVPAGMGEAWYSGEPYHGEDITLEASPAVSAYDFSHWQFEGDTLSKENPFSFVLTGDMTIEAVFIVVIGQDELVADAIQLYPNPGNGVFNLQLPADANVQVFNRQGQMVYADDATGGLNQLNLEKLGKGVYTIRLKGIDFVEMRQVIIL